MNADVCAGDAALKEWVDSALSKNDVVILSETHGTREAPETFLRMVCAALASQESIVIGMELPDTAMDAVRRMVTPDDLRESSYWMNAHDGRTSTANLKLLARLLMLEKSGAVKLIGFDIRATGGEPFGQDAGKFIREVIAQAGGSKALLLMGRGHADFTSGNNSISHYLSAAGYRTLVVDLQTSGGEAWVCRMGVCGVSSAPDTGCGEPTSVPILLSATDGIRQHATMCAGKSNASEPATGRDEA